MTDNPTYRDWSDEHVSEYEYPTMTEFARHMMRCHSLPTLVAMRSDREALAALHREAHNK